MKLASSPRLPPGDGFDETFYFSFHNFCFLFFPRGFTEPPLALVPRAKYRHGLARARPDSPAFRPLHSLPHSATPTPQDAFARSDGHKLPRQVGTSCAAQVEES